jgi:hypothetical protein
VENGLGFRADLIRRWEGVGLRQDSVWSWRKELTGGTELSAAEGIGHVTVRLRSDTGPGLDSGLGQIGSPGLFPIFLYFFLFSFSDLPFLL